MGVGGWAGWWDGCGRVFDKGWVRVEVGLGLGWGLWWRGGGSVGCWLGDGFIGGGISWVWVFIYISAPVLVLIHPIYILKAFLNPIV